MIIRYIRVLQYIYYIIYIYYNTVYIMASCNHKYPPLRPDCLWCILSVVKNGWDKWEMTIYCIIHCASVRGWKRIQFRLSTVKIARHYEKITLIFHVFRRLYYYFLARLNGSCFSAPFYFLYRPRKYIQNYSLNNYYYC